MRLLLILLCLCSGCVMRAALAGGPNAQGLRVYHPASGTYTTYGLAYQRETPRRSPQLAAPGPQPIHRNTRTGKLHTRVLVAGGHVELIGLPTRSTQDVVLAFRPVAALRAEPCKLRMHRDGIPLAIDQLTRRGDHELLATLRAEDLLGLDHATRLSAEACGQTFELDPAGRQTFANFAAQFREAATTTPAHGRYVQASHAVSRQ